MDSPEERTTAQFYAPVMFVHHFLLGENVGGETNAGAESNKRTQKNKKRLRLPGLIAAGATIAVFTTGRGSTIGNAIAPVVKLTSNNEIFHRMSGDLDLSAGDVLDGAATVQDVGAQLFSHLCRVASGEVLAKAEIHKHREFQVWAEQAVSL